MKTEHNIIKYLKKIRLTLLPDVKIGSDRLLLGKDFLPYEQSVRNPERKSPGNEAVQMK